MKPIIAIVAALTMVAPAFAQNLLNAPFIMESAGHRLEFQFKTAIETNPPASIFVNGYNANMLMAYNSWPPAERPFPRTEEAAEIFNVTSNTYAIYILDSKTTNVVATSSVKLGTLTRSRKTLITTTTNTINCETFAPEK